jgi:hypothetical protein
LCSPALIYLVPGGRSGGNALARSLSDTIPTPPWRQDAPPTNQVPAAATDAYQAERLRLDERHAANESRWLLEIDRGRRAAKEGRKTDEYTSAPCLELRLHPPLAIKLLFPTLLIRATMARAAQNLKLYDARKAAVMDQGTGSTDSVPTKLKLAAAFEPCPLEGGDEVFCNGIFEFNITRLITFIGSRAYPTMATRVWIRRPSRQPIFRARSCLPRSLPAASTSSRAIIAWRELGAMVCPPCPPTGFTARITWHFSPRRWPTRSTLSTGTAGSRKCNQDDKGLHSEPTLLGL